MTVTAIGQADEASKTIGENVRSAAVDEFGVSDGEKAKIARDKVGAENARIAASDDQSRRGKVALASNVTRAPTVPIEQNTTGEQYSVAALEGKVRA
ncbi:MAG: hypothetical protein ACAI38_04340 [Myxococcota bacterium]|nr:hypothetical protein [Myxococcota bacterium]